MKRPALYILIPLCLGIAVARLFNIPILFSAIAALLFLACTVIFSRNRLSSGVYLCIAMLAIGALCYGQHAILPPNHISNFISDRPRNVLLSGVIIDDPVTKNTPLGSKSTTFTLSSRLLKEKRWIAVSGPVKVSLASEKEPRYKYGEELVLDGVLSGPNSLRNPGVFNYSGYLKMKGIYAVLKVRGPFNIKALGAGHPNPIRALSFDARHGLSRILDEYLDNPARAFMKAILLGYRSELDPDIKDDFIKTGTVHILAISGLHVGLVASVILISSAALGIPRKMNLVLTTMLLIFYAFLTGSSPPIVRAVIMFGIFTAGYAINRDSDTLNSLASAGILMLLWNPNNLFDPSFQLSYVSVAGIILFYPVITGFFGNGPVYEKNLLLRTGSYAIKGVAISVSAWLGSWPIVASYFNIVSPISIISNLVIVPLSFLLIILAFALFLLNYISSFLGSAIACLLTMVGDLLFYLNHLLSTVKFSYFRTASPKAAFFILYYAFVSLLLLPKDLRYGKAGINRKNILAGLLIISNIVVWTGNFRHSPEAMKITFLDVGQGDSIHIQLPDNGSIIIDGGSGGEEEGAFDVGKNVIAPYLWNKGIKKIDAVIVTHFHEDHLGGLIYILNNFDVGRVMDNGAHSNSMVYKEYLGIIRKKGIPRVILREGDVIRKGRISIFVLNPPEHENITDTNDNSLVMKLVYDKFSCLFCGDVQDEAVERISPYGDYLKSDIIKIPHHGSRLKNMTSANNFFENVSAKIKIISSARINQYDEESHNLNNSITNYKSISYDTKYSGAIEIIIDESSFKTREYSK